MANRGDDAQEPAAAGSAAPNPVITDVDNNAATPAKKLKKDDPNQEVRIHGKNFTSKVKVKLESSSGHNWTPHTHNNVMRQGADPDYYVVVKAKAHKTRSGGLWWFLVRLVFFLLRLRFSDTGDLTVTITNDPPTTISPKKSYVVDYL